MEQRKRQADAERAAEEAKYANEVLPDPSMILKEFLATKGKKNVKELWRKIQKKCPSKEELAS